MQAIDRCLASGWPVRAVAVADRRGAVAVGRGRSSTRCPTPSTWSSPRRCSRGWPTARSRPSCSSSPRIPDRDLVDVPRSADGVVVLVDRPSSPGNLGTIIRTADALGAAGVLTTRPRRPPLRPAHDPGERRLAVRAARSCPCRATRRWSSGSTAGGRRRRTSPCTPPTRPATSCSTARRAPDAPGPRCCSAPSAPACREALRDLADATVAIPMAGSASSLNVAVAHGIVLHHLLSIYGDAPCLTTCPSPS